MTQQDNDQGLAARRLRARNWALFGLLFGFVAAIYLITIIKVGH